MSTQIRPTRSSVEQMTRYSLDQEIVDVLASPAEPLAPTLPPGDWRALRDAIALELQVHPSVPLGYDTTAPESGVTQRAMADRLRVLAAL